VWLGAGAALALIAVLILISALGGRSTAPAGVPDGAPSAGASALPAPERRAPGDSLALGRPDAPVVIVEWADFQCPYCGAFATETEPDLVERYIKAGKARLEWRDFAFLGPESTRAALAARAAARQGRFWAYHDALYANQKPENSGALTAAYLTALAGRLGLDQARFRADLDDPALARQVRADQVDGTRRGVTGTPTFFINGELVSGAQPLAEFQKVIDSALTRAAAAR
jgi:protein-disulfide isomerase